MEHILRLNQENEIRQPAATYSKMIDGKMFVIRAFFPSDNAETFQEKIERMLKAVITKSVRQTAFK